MLERCTSLLKALFIVVDPGLRSSVRMSERPLSNHVRMAFPQTSLGLLCCFKTTKEAEGGEGEEKIRKSWKRGVQGQDFVQFTAPASARHVPGAPGETARSWWGGRMATGGGCRWMTRMALGVQSGHHVSSLDWHDKRMGRCKICPVGTGQVRARNSSPEVRRQPVGPSCDPLHPRWFLRDGPAAVLCILTPWAIQSSPSLVVSAGLRCGEIHVYV
jgi:hypothetical protein